MAPLKVACSRVVAQVADRAALHSVHLEQARAGTLGRYVAVGYVSPPPAPSRPLEALPAVALQRHRSFSRIDRFIQGLLPERGEDLLDEVMMNYPGHPSFQLYGERNFQGIVDKIGTHLLRFAQERTGMLWILTEEALYFWDRVAKHVYGDTLEEHVMKNAGYTASSFLPSGMRRHVVRGAEMLEGNYSECRDISIRNRATELLPRLVAGVVGGGVIKLAHAIAEYEYHYPQWRGFLSHADFEKSGDSFEFRPRPANERLLERLALVGDDPFPEIRMSVAAGEDAARIRGFLERYRAAERLVYDGDHDQTHCGQSADMVVNLMRRKGVEAYAAHIHRLCTGDQYDAVIGRAVYGLAKELSLSFSTIRSLMSKMSHLSELSAEDERMLIADWEVDQTKVRRIFEWCSQLATDDRGSLLSGWGHKVAIARLGKRWYLIDINQQQFGEEYDRLLFIPVEEAPNNGVILQGIGEDIFLGREFKTNFKERIDCLCRGCDAFQLVIREYMRMLDRTG